MKITDDAPMGVGRRPGGPPAVADFSDEDRIRLAGQRATERFRCQLDLAAEAFAEQPTANCVLAASRRLCAAIASLASDMAKEMERAAC